MKEAFEYQDSYEFRIPPEISRGLGATAMGITRNSEIQRKIENFQRRHNI